MWGWLLRGCGLCGLAALGACWLVVGGVWSVGAADAPVADDGGIRPVMGFDWPGSESPAVPSVAPPVAQARAAGSAGVDRDSARARGQRRASRAAYRGLSASEALGVARDEGAGSVLPPVWRGVRPGAGEHVAGFLDASTARLADGRGRAVGLVRSSLPLRVIDDSGRQAATNLSLQHRGDHFESVNPIVASALPGSASGPVSLGDVGLSLSSGVPVDSAAQVDSDRLFYANVAVDTDQTLTPLPQGVELGWQLRSPQSPERLAVRLDLPLGASLVQRGGGVDVVRGGAVLASLPAPRAVDAQGVAVEASFVVDGETVTTVVAHRDRDLAYPVAVDPVVVESQLYWHCGGSIVSCSADQVGWTAHTGGYGFATQANPDGVLGGLFVSTVANWWMSPGAYGQWEFYAPNVDGGNGRSVWPVGSAFVFRAEFYNSAATEAHTCAYEGIWGASGWESAYQRTVPNGSWGPTWGGLHLACVGLAEPWTYRELCVSNGCSTETGSSGNIPVAGLNNGASAAITASGGAYNWIGGTALYINDRESPTISAYGGDPPTGWIKDTNFTPQAFDDGLGIQHVTISSSASSIWPNGSGPYDNVACYGIRLNRCPHDVSY